MDNFRYNLEDCTKFNKDAIKTAIHDIRKANYTLMAMKKYQMVEKIQSKIQGTNNNVKPQRFFSTKKKNKVRKRNTLTKPNQEEKDDLENIDDDDWFEKIGEQVIVIDDDEEDM